MTLEIAAKFIASPLAPRTFVNQSSVYNLRSSVLQSPAISECSLQSLHVFKCQMAHELRTQLEIIGKRWNLHQMLTKNAAAGSHLTFPITKIQCWPSYICSSPSGSVCELSEDSDLDLTLPAFVFIEFDCG